jgi:acyl transferase domain-containing protein
VDIAAENSPNSVVISSFKDAATAAVEALEAAGLKVTKLGTTHGFHSAQIEAAMGPLREVAVTLHPQPPKEGIQVCGIPTSNNADDPA